jgi:hypothetical protein
MKNITVIVDRIDGSTPAAAAVNIKKILTALIPLRKKGLRVRVTRSHRTLVEDKVWR